MTRGQSVDVARTTPPRRSYLFVVYSPLHHTGGVNQAVINLHREMVLAGELEPLIMIDDWSASRPVESVIDGRLTIRMRLWPAWSERSSIVGVLSLIIAAPLWIFDLLQLFRRHGVLAVNYHFPGVSVIAFAILRFLRLFRGDLIISFHGLDLSYAQESGRIEHALWRFVFCYATAIVACSKAFAADVAAFAGKRSMIVRAIQNGLDLDRFLGSVDRGNGFSAVLRGREYIVSVATWEWKKGLDILLRAFKEVTQRNSDIVLVLIGRSGEAESSLRALAVELGVTSRVLFLGEVPHARVGLYLEHARVFCLPSRAEPFGIAILEAGAYRLPVVASRVGGIPEIVTDGETGLLVEPGDAGALAAVLGRVLSDPDLARTLGERLHRRVADSFTWKRAYEAYRALLSLHRVS